MLRAYSDGGLKMQFLMVGEAEDVFPDGLRGIIRRQKYQWRCRLDKG